MTRDLPAHVGALLRAAHGHVVAADNGDAGFERLRGIAGEWLDPALFQAALAACLRDGLIRDPVRLEAGSLHCHWRLELTPAGREAARALIGD